MIRDHRVLLWKISNINKSSLCCLPVSAKAANGSDSLSLLSDSSAMAMRPLIRSTWLGCWLDWQMDVKTSPIRLQSSCLVQS